MMGPLEMSEASAELVVVVVLFQVRAYIETCHFSRIRMQTMCRRSQYFDMAIQFMMVNAESVECIV